MSGKPSFDLAVVGLDAQSLQLIEVVFQHVRHNRYLYRLVDGFAPGQADILIAGVGDRSGRAALARARATVPPMAAIAVVRPGEAAATRHAVEFGQLVRQLLPILNRVVELEGLAGGPRRIRTVDAVPTARPRVRREFTLPPRPRVLVVDDDATHRALLAGGLARLGVEVDVVTSAGDALARLAVHPADLAMVELDLPDGDGLRLASAIRGEPRWRELPVVVMGGRRSTLDVIRSAAAGCSAFLAKPVDFTDLRLTVARELGRGRPPGSLPPKLRLESAPS